MSDINYLPRNLIRSFRRAASASDAVRNMMLVYHPGYTTVFDNFLGDLIRDEYAAAATNGTSAAVSVASSRLTLTTGTDDDGYAGQAFGLFWKGDNGIYLESAQSLDTLTTAKLEVGLTDATADAGAVATKATPTGTADDFCVLCFDTDDNTQLDIIYELDNGGTAVGAENVYSLVGGTIFRTEFVSQNDACRVFVNGADVGGGAFQGGDLVTPWFFAQSRAGTASRILTVEYMFCTGPNGLAIP